MTGLPPFLSGGIISFRNQSLKFADLPIAEREQCLSTLQDSFDDASKGQATCVILEGAEGSGKATLIESFRETQECAAETVFCCGNFERTKSEPYGGIVEALNQLTAWIVKTQDQQTWKNVLSKALADELQVLEFLVPALHMFLDAKQSSGHDYYGTPNASENTSRVRLAVRAFLRVVSSTYQRGTLMVVFNNIEWADPDSLEVIRGLLDEDSGTRMLLICTHRPVSNLTNLVKFQEDVQSRTVHLRMRDLSEEELGSWISELYRRDMDSEIVEFACKLHKCCHGNPFFAARLLQLLQCVDIVWPSGDSYDWDQDKLNDFISERLTVIDVIARTMEHSSDAVQIALRTAACLDSTRISADLLFYALTSNRELCVAKSVKQVSGILDEAVEDGFLRRNQEQEYEFEHDLFRMAALSLIHSKRKQQAMHLQIGRHLRELVESLPECRRDLSFRNRLLLQAVKQINLGLGEVDDKEENATLRVEVNYQAADVHTKRLNYSGARTFLERARDALGGPRSWKTQYELTLRVVTALSRSLYYTGNFEGALSVADEIIDRAKGADDAAEGGYSTRILCLTQQGKFDLAKQTCLDVLHKYKLNYSEKFLRLQFRIEERRTRRLLVNAADDEILRMNPALSPTTQNQMMFTNRLMEALMASRTNSLLFNVARFRLMQLTMRHGFVDASCFAFACWGWAAIDRYNLREAYRYGSLGMALARRTDSVLYRGRTGSTFHVYIAHWQRPVWESLEPMKAVLDDYWRHGLLESYFMEAFVVIIIAYTSGEILDKQIAFTSRLSELDVDFQQERNHITHLPLYQMLANLSGRSSSGSTLTGEYMEEKAHLEAITASDNVTALHQFYWTKLVLCVMFDDFEQAAKATESLDAVAKEPRPTPALPFRLLYAGIVYFSLYDKTRKPQYLETANKALVALKKWVKSGAASYEHMYLLLQAESLSAKGDETRESILVLYQRSILGAAGQGMVHNEALANERLGQFLMRSGGHRQNTIVYLSKAKDLYLKWGSRPKATQLRRTIDRFREISANELAASSFHKLGWSDMTATTVSIETHNSIAT